MAWRLARQKGERAPCCVVSKRSRQDCESRSWPAIIDSSAQEREDTPMLERHWFAAIFLSWLLAVTASAETTVSFDWFEYTGRDAVFELEKPPGHYRNPILAGFYPDPSITRAGEKYYMVHSTFAYFPGI